MHALASQVRYQDISRNAEPEYQRTSRSHSTQESSISDSAAGGIDRRMLTNTTDSNYAFRRSTTKEAWSPRISHSSTDMFGGSSAPLQRLEQLESGLASLNHARRRLAVDDDVETGGASLSAARYGAVSDQTTMFDRDRDSVHPVDDTSSIYATAGVGDQCNLNVRPWISSFSEVADPRRLPMCGGGSVFSRSTDADTTFVQTFSTTSSTFRAPSCVTSSVAGFVDAPPFGGSDDGPPPEWRDAPVRMSTGGCDVQKGHETAASSTSTRTPVKQEPVSPPPDSATPAAESLFILGILTLYCSTASR